MRCLILVLALKAVLLVGPSESISSPAAFDFYDRGPYRPGIPRPVEVLGYEPGTFHTNYGNMERYIERLVAAASDRVVREPFGRTYEFRERALLIITSPENHRRIEAIRAASLKLADPRRLSTSGEAERLIAETPVTVWLNYSIHGDESASFEAMMQVAYQLAAGNDSLTRAILDRAVVILNPAHNPDGHERFVTWINALGSGNPDPWALEQQREQPWGIGGRTNHYQFDMNRDALAMSQIESRQMSHAVLRWRPQVFVDHHGQTESYFFPPTAAPLNPVLPDASYQRWNEIFGRANAEAFDRYGWVYYVRDIFDFFYPGYWDTWPTLHGAVGMTYETDGGGNLAIRRDDETVVTLKDGIQRHFVASLATCRAAVEHREARLRDFYQFAWGAIEEAKQGAVKAFALDPARDPLAAGALAENLLTAGVEVQWVAAPFRATAQPVWADPSEPGARKQAAWRDHVGNEAPPHQPFSVHEFRRGAYVVDLAQPAGRLARTLINRDALVAESFARSQLEKYERNIARGKNAPREFYDFYDVTSWSLPIAYGVEAFSLRALPGDRVPLRPPGLGERDPGVESVPDSAALGIPMTARESRGGPLELRDANDVAVVNLVGNVEGGKARTAYVWAYDRDGAARLALRLLQEDFKVATATRPLRAGGRSFPRGSFLVRVERNPDTVHGRVAELARVCGVQVLAVHSAYADQGDTGVGSEAIESLKRPRIAVVVDGPVSPNAYGWLWFLLERRLGYRFTAVRAEAIGSADLDRYNVLVVPDGRAHSLASAIGEAAIEKIKNWVMRGGVLLCMEDAAEFPTLKEVGLSTARVVKVKKEKPDRDGSDKAPTGEAKSDSTDEWERRPEYVPGAVFWATLDPRHFLAYGYPARRIPVLIQGNLFLETSKQGVNPARFDERPLKLSGWTWPETEKRIEGTAYAVDEPQGQGHVIMIVGAPAFRLFWRGTERLIMNSLLFAPTLD